MFKYVFVDERIEYKIKKFGYFYHLTSHIYKQEQNCREDNYI